jgi:hypothetical protein
VRLAISVLAVLAVAARGNGCAPTDWDPCEDAACGTACRLCAPDDGHCVETAVVKACDASRECVAATPDLCGAPMPLPGTCEGKRCDAACELAPPCALQDPPCALPMVPGRCSADGVCTAAAMVPCPSQLDPGYDLGGGGITFERRGTPLDRDYSINGP